MVMVFFIHNCAVILNISMALVLSSGIANHGRADIQYNRITESAILLL